MGSDWKYSTVAECASEEPYSTQIGPFGNKIKAEIYTLEGTPVLRGTNVNTSARFNDSDFVFIDQNYANSEFEKFTCKAGDVVLCHKGTLGKIGIIPQDSKFETYIMGNSMMKVRTDERKLNPLFLYYWLCSSGGQDYLFSRVSQTGVPQIQRPLSTLREAEIPLPPLPEQKAIAHILGSLDDKIELNRRMNATLEGMAQALFKSWFVNFDPVIDNALAAGNPIPDELADRAEVRRGNVAPAALNRNESDGAGTPSESDLAPAAFARTTDGAGAPSLPEINPLFPSAFQHTESMGWIPEGWEINCFGGVSTCFDRKRIPLSKPQREAKKPGKIPYYGATSIMDYVNEWIFDDTYLLIGEDGSVIKEDGTPFVQYIWGKSWVNNHAHVLQGKDGISTEHLMLFMQSKNLAAYVTGAVQLKINQKNMNSIPFLKASNLVNLQFSEAVIRLYERIKLLSEENETLTNLRDTLLPKLISGYLLASEINHL